MARARALIVTSHVESFSLVLVEAMYCGAVAISVDCPFGPREVLENGRFGLLSPQNDAASLAESMQLIACDDDLYHRLRERGRERAQEYGLPRVIPDWEEMFASIAFKDDGKK
jgi:glycosyltransferase involved in cell wall biosynthesis